MTDVNPRREPQLKHLLMGGLDTNGDPASMQAVNPLVKAAQPQRRPLESEFAADRTDDLVGLADRLRQIDEAHAV
jgi:hypothetical protein